MIALFRLCVALFVSPFKSKSRLEAENAAASQTILLQREKIKRQPIAQRRLQLQRHAA
jgi:hypothetical protein